VEAAARRFQLGWRRAALSKSFLFCGLAIAAAAALRASAPPPDSDLPVDPLVTYGMLSNGVRYVLRPRTGAYGRIALRLVVDAGSLDETDGQRGIAHLLEHMAFEGSDHFPPGAIAQFLQRQGMALGPDANANTTFDRTTYLLELRHNDPASIDQALNLFRDFGGGLLLPAAGLARQRGIVLSEKLSRDSVTARLQEAQMRFCLAGTLLPQRITIGDAAIIAHADRNQLKAFYDAWYRPDRLTVLAVGDFDPAAMAAAIKSHFGHLRGRGRSPTPPPFGRIANAPGVQVKYLGDSEVPGASIKITVLHQGAAPPDSAQTRLQDLPLQMAFLMFNRRLSEVASRAGAPFTAAGAVCEERLNLFRETSVAVAAPGNGWRPALTAAEHELRRALQFGFQPAELKVASAVFAQQLEQEARSAPTLASVRVANLLVEDLKAGKVFVTAADQLNLLVPALSQMSTDTCNAAFRTAWSSPARFVTVAGDLPHADDADKLVATVYGAAASEAVAAVAATEVAPWSYTQFGPPGVVTAQRSPEQLGATLAQFANGTRVNLKSTRMEANRIRIQVRVGTGLLEEPLRQPGLGLFAEESFFAGGLNRYRENELKQVLSGKTVSLKFTVEDDAFRLDAITDREDLLLELQWIAATIADSAFRPEAEAAAKSRILGIYSQLGHTANGPLVAELPRLLASNDRRLGYPLLQDVERRTTTQLRAWLGPQLATGPLELTIVGDFDEDGALAAVAQTLGALPSRHPPRPMDAQRLVTFPTPPLRWERTVKSEIPAAAVGAYWPTDAATDEHLRCQLDLLAAILQERVLSKLREQLGATYTPESSSYAPKAFPGYGYLRTHVTVDPSKADLAAAALNAIGASLASRSITAEELERARVPLAARAHDLERTNDYWLESLATVQVQPYTIEWARVRGREFDTVAADDLNRLAASVFRPENFCVAIVRPVKE